MSGWQFGTYDDAGEIVWQELVLPDPPETEREPPLIFVDPDLTGWVTT